MKKLISLTILALIVPGFCLAATSSTVRVSVIIPELPAQFKAPQASAPAVAEVNPTTTETTTPVTTREARDGTIVLVQTIVDR